MHATLIFQPDYLTLPPIFYSAVAPARAPHPEVVLYNQHLAEALNLDLGADAPDALARLLSGHTLPEGAHPLALAYAGHQYGYFTMLGDGRAHLIAQCEAHGTRYDIQLKGSGQTPYSRRGDGKAVLAPMLREYIISEAMAALGIPTTRSLAVVATGEMVLRDAPLPGAVLVRVASSHLRVGTFEYAAARRDLEALKALADYAITRHDADIARDAPDRYAQWLTRVITRQAALMAQWLSVGFIHGVMNTDNTTISGETIDYGPCAFMDSFDADAVFSSIDRDGRYRFAQQPAICHWNLSKLAEALLPLLADDMEQAETIAEAVLEKFASEFQTQWNARMRQKLGLTNAEEEDAALIQELFALMQHASADYTNTLRALALVDAPAPLFVSTEGKQWHARWQARLGRMPAQDQHTYAARMCAVNPARIPRNHGVEEALSAASDHGDFAPLHRLLQALKKPFEEDAQYEAYSHPPAPSARVYQTFCGT